MVRIFPYSLFQFGSLLFVFQIFVFSPRQTLRVGVEQVVHGHHGRVCSHNTGVLLLAHYICLEQLKNQAGRVTYIFEFQALCKFGVL